MGDRAAAALPEVGGVSLGARSRSDSNRSATADRRAVNLKHLKSSLHIAMGRIAFVYSIGDRSRTTRSSVYKGINATTVTVRNHTVHGVAGQVVV